MTVTIRAVTITALLMTVMIKAVMIKAILLMTVMIKAIIKATIRAKAFIRTPPFVKGIAVMFMTGITVGITVILIMKGPASRVTLASALLT